MMPEGTSVVRRAACLFAALGSLVVGGAASADVDVTVKESAGVGATQFPTTVVIPLPEGQFADTSGFSLGVPAQFEVLERWVHKDNSIRHVAAHFQASVPAGGQAVYTFTTGGANPAPPQPVQLTTSGSTITVTTGPLRFVVNAASFKIFDAVWYDVDGDGQYESGEELIVPSASNGARLDACDTPSSAACTSTPQPDSGLTPDSVTIEESGPLRAVIRLERYTRYAGIDNMTHGYVVRIYAYAGSPRVKVDYQLVNAATADHGNTLRGGKWSDPFYFDALSLDFALQLGSAINVRTGIASGVDTRALDANGVELAYTLHDRYALRQAGGATTFSTCTDAATNGTNDCDTAGFMDISDGRFGVQVAMRNMWELWPSGFEINGGKRLQVQLFPDWAGNWHDGAARSVYWLDDMQAVVKEVLFNFHGPTPSDAELNATARTFDRYPVPTLPASYYRATAVTMDLDGLMPGGLNPDSESSRLETNSTSSMDETQADGYTMSWRHWHADDRGRLYDNEVGGEGPISGEEFYASGSPADYWDAERWTWGDINTRPIWMGKDYTHGGDWSALRLEQDPYGNGTPHQLHWRDDGDPSGHGGSYPIAGSGRYAEARDWQHAWFYHVPDWYWASANPWVKDWMTWMGEFTRRVFVADAEGDVQSQRGIGHATWRQWQSYRITGNTALLDEIADWFARERRPELSPRCGTDVVPGYPYSTASLETAFMLRALQSTLREFRGSDWQRWASTFLLASAHEEWIQWYGRYGYRNLEQDCQVHAGSSGTAHGAPDPVAHYYWITGKSRFKTFNDTYANSGISGSRPYVTSTPEGRLFVVDTGASGYGDNLWDGRYEGRAYFFVDDEARPDAVPPAAVTDLSASLASQTLTATFTRPSGSPSYYLLVWAALPIEECTANCTADPEATNTTGYRNWWAAMPAAAADTTACNGATCTLQIPGVTAAPAYAAVFSFDAANNMSARSNVAVSTAGQPTVPPPPQQLRVN
jgi:hypothetical protein